jgi:hypothetical protein
MGYHKNKENGQINNMNPLSLWAMMWQLGVFCCVVTPIVVIVGMVIFMMFKPINFFDKL